MSHASSLPRKIRETSLLLSRWIGLRGLTMTTYRLWAEALDGAAAESAIAASSVILFSMSFLYRSARREMMRPSHWSELGSLGAGDPRPSVPGWEGEPGAPA